jgi:hypothetical protein
MIRRGLLSDLFVGVGVKKLAAVDADPSSSNQHEVTGSKPLLQILGDQDRTFPSGGTDNRFAATYIWLGGEQEAIAEEGRLSWYDSRRNDPKRSAEWRLYYQSNSITQAMRTGDYLFVARRQSDHLLFIVVPAESTVFSQLLWLFGLEEQPQIQFSVRDISDSQTNELDFAARYILDEIGIELEETETDRLDNLLNQFGNKFPTTRTFSELARSSIAHIDPRDNADAALMAWIEQEELLFRRLERRIVDERLRSGFLEDNVADVDGFLSFSLSVQNRRKSRAGQSLENHLETLFTAHGLRFERGVETESRNKPDFLFPGQSEYRDLAFPSDRLTMLGAKSTLKDRWRQVLNEAVRIKSKHLITLEPGISKNQTDQMQVSSLQLVIPERLHKTFQPVQQKWLLTVKDFLALVISRQRPARALGPSTAR